MDEVKGSGERDAVDEVKGSGERDARREMKRSGEAAGEDSDGVLGAGSPEAGRPR